MASSTSTTTDTTTTDTATTDTTPNLSINITSTAPNLGVQKFGPLEVGSTHTLTWSSTSASTCSAAGDWSGSKEISGSESFTEIYSGTKTYTLTCNAEGTNSISKSVSLEAIPKSGSAIDPYYQSIIPESLPAAPTNYVYFNKDTRVQGQLEGLSHESTEAIGAGKFIFNRVYRPFKHGLQWGEQFGVFGSWLSAYGANSIEGGLWVNPKTTGPEYFPTLHLSGIGDAYHACNDLTSGFTGMYEVSLADKWLTMIQISNKIIAFPGHNIAFDKDQNRHESDNGIWIGQGWTYLNLAHPRDYKFWISFIESYDYQGPVNGYMPEHWNWIDPEKIDDGSHAARVLQQNQDEGGYGTFATKGSSPNGSNGNERIGLQGLSLGNDIYFVPTHKLPLYKNREYLLQHPQSISQSTMESYSTSLRNNSLSDTLIGSTVKIYEDVYKSTHNQLKMVEQINDSEHRFMIEPSYNIGFEGSLGYVDWGFLNTDGDVIPAKKAAAQNQNGYLFVRKLTDKWVVEDGASTDYKNHPNQYQTEIIDNPDATLRVPNITHKFFSYKEKDASNSEFSNWDTTGMTRYTVTLQNGAVVTYVWFKFIEQPAVLTAKQNHPETYTDAYLQSLQTYIENLHTNINNHSTINPNKPTFINYRGAVNPDNKDPHLVKLDPAHLVDQIEGKKVGYVPIVISLYYAENYSENGVGKVSEPNETCTNAKWTDTYYPDF